MRILYLTKSFAAKAGVERVLSDKMNWLAENGYEIMFLTYEQGNHSKAFSLHPSIIYKDLDARFFKLSQFSMLKKCVEYFRCRNRFRKNLQLHVDHFKPDVIITTTYQLKLLDLFFKVKTQAKLVIESHVACYKAQKSGDFSRNSLFYYLAKLYDSYFLRQIKKFDILVALTEGDANDWKKYIEKVMIIPDPITFFPSDKELDKKQNTHRIIAVGRLNEQKGFDLLIDAFSKIADLCPEWTVDIFGSGGDKELLKAMIVNNHLENRVFLNSSTSDIYKEYMKSDFLVLSSRYEGYALVLNEAMSCCLPCVAFRCKYGPEDVITDGQNGVLVPDGDVKKLSDYMLWMIEHRKERILMGNAARLSSVSYKKDVIMQEWVGLFSSLINRSLPC